MGKVVNVYVWLVDRDIRTHVVDNLYARRRVAHGRGDCSRYPTRDHQAEYNIRIHDIY